MTRDTDSMDKEQFLKMMAQCWQIHCGQMVRCSLRVLCSGVSQLKMFTNAVSCICFVLLRLRKTTKTIS